MYIIVGLGNPTPQYEKTRHNAGFDALDVIARKNDIQINTVKFQAIFGSGIILTYMNLSGEAIQQFVRFYKINPEEELLVIYDDISLDPGKLRLRKKGSAGGHNGIKSIIACLGTETFKRIKIGVGQKPANWDLIDFVLGHFSKEDRILVEDAFERTEAATKLVISDQFDKAMNQYN